MSIHQHDDFRSISVLYKIDPLRKKGELEDMNFTVQHLFL